MSSKLLMNNIVGGDNMQIQKGIVTATRQDEAMKVTGLTFIPDIIIIRIISDISTGAHSLVWVYTPYASLGIRSDSDGVSAGVLSSVKYTDNGYTKGPFDFLKLIDGGFMFSSVSAFSQIQANDQFEWTAIKYL